MLSLPPGSCPAAELGSRRHLAAGGARFRPRKTGRSAAPRLSGARVPQCPRSWCSEGSAERLPPRALSPNAVRREGWDMDEGLESASRRASQTAAPLPSSVGATDALCSLERVPGDGDVEACTDCTYAFKAGWLPQQHSCCPYEKRAEYAGKGKHDREADFLAHGDASLKWYMRKCAKSLSFLKLICFVIPVLTSTIGVER